MPTQAHLEMDKLVSRILKKIGKERLAEVQSDNPNAMHKRLYDAARRRGYVWGFSITDNSVIVYVRDSKSKAQRLMEQIKKQFENGEKFVYVRGISNRDYIDKAMKRRGLRWRVNVISHNCLLVTEK